MRIKLFTNTVPKTVANFKKLCEPGATPAKSVHDTAKDKHYVGSKFFRIWKGFFLHGGDYIYNTGKGNEGADGMVFRDENFLIKHDQKYLLSMVTRGRHTNGSQFLITLDKLPMLDDLQVVFGMIHPDDVAKIDTLEAEGTTASTGTPANDVTITHCQELEPALT